MPHSQQAIATSYTANTKPSNQSEGVHPKQEREKKKLVRNYRERVSPVRFFI